MVSNNVALISWEIKTLLWNMILSFEENKQKHYLSEAIV